MSSQPFTKLFKLCANVSLVGFLFVCAHASADASQDAGEVTFLIGKAFINGSTPVEIGSKISSGDEIQTLSNGHVHVRFIDNGLISVRPDSRLAIEHYDYNPDAPQSSVIKFNLEDGVMRSISGAGAKAARDKFRLNTPIAAIGVRGTDFVVKASDDLLQAVVNEGAIVVAPFTNKCTIYSIGPCKANSVELSSLDSTKLQLDNNGIARLIPLNNSQPSMIADTNSDIKLKNNLNEKSNLQNEELRKRQLDETEKQAQNLLLASYQDTSKIERQTGSIAWGRFSNNQITQNQLVNITSHLLASEGRSAGVIANSLNSGLIISFRPESTTETIAPNLGRVNFTLNELASQASLTTTEGAVYRVDITKADLSINFANRVFDTYLEMYNPLISNLSFSAEGTLDRFGYFYSQGTDSSISLLTTLEGNESSYHFTKEVASGAIEGITFWQD